jgi:protoporphyrinogen/coproporphyrinogen III oxidase
MRVAIIGGGISGLSAAFYLERERRKGAQVEYVLYEAESRLGGSMLSESVDGCVVEAGPDSFVSEKPAAAQLAADLGIADQLIGSNDEKRKTYILVNGRLVVMPDGLMFMVPTKILPTGLSPLFSWTTKLRMIGELFHPPRPMQKDETVAEMVERHFGGEMVDRLADPLLSGIYGGDASMLSARAVLPRFVEMEEKYGSLSRAMLVASKKMKSASKQPAKPRPLFTSMKNGMQQMVDAVVAHIDMNSVRMNTGVLGLRRDSQRWTVELDGRSAQFDGVILCTPARIGGKLLESTDAALGRDLQSIPYSSSVTVILGYEMEKLRNLPPGFGYLVPKSEGMRMRACTFVHNKFPHRAPADKGLLRCFLGGAGNEEVLTLADSEILNIVRRELKQVLKLDADPRFTRIFRWRGAMAQYGSGHLDRVGRIEKATAAIPGLALAGNAYRGIGVPDCIRTGQAAALQMVNGVRV